MSRPVMILTLISLLTGVMSLPAFAQPNFQELEKTLDRVLDSATQYAAGIVQRNAVVRLEYPGHGFVYRKGRGIATADGQSLMTAGHQFYVESITALAQGADDHSSELLSTRVLIQSSILQEARPIKMRLPRNYEVPESRYPVLFVLDADHEDHFKKAVADAERLADRGEIPWMIIVGVENTNRLRDMNVPDFEYQGQLIEGRAGKFLDFIDKELVPHINEKYRTTYPSVVFGASASAVFSIYAMVSRPTGFVAYIASSPSFFVNADLLNGNTRSFFAKKESLDRIFFLNLGTEDTAKRVRQTKEYADLVEQLAPPEFKWEVRVMNGFGHVPETSLEDGLQMVFSRIAK